jgi:hypothetical protein
MRANDELERQLKGVVLVQAILDARGVDTHELELRGEELRRARARGSSADDAKGGDAHSVAA